MNTAKYFVIAALLLGPAGTSFAQQDNQVVEPVSQAELEQILAPIALYPDTVLAHILVAATYPIEVVQAQRWTDDNPDLRGSDAVEAVDDKDWDPSVKALVAFPHILQRLSEDLEWTDRLGVAFLQDEESLLAGVQSLRQRAYDEGSLDDLDKMSITREDEAIIIQPVEREVVYVPYYDTRRVYGNWRWSRFPPVYWDCPYHNHHYAGYRHDPFYWGPRFHISFGFHFSSFHWRNHHVVRIPRHHYNPRRYYNHHQIVRHHEARPWRHNPRGVGYYNSRSTSRPAIAGPRGTIRAEETRVSAPNRIRDDLRQGRPHVSERSYRGGRDRAYPAFRPGQSRAVANSRQSAGRSDTAPVRPNTAPVRPATRSAPAPRPAARASAPAAPPIARVPAGVSRVATPSIQRSAPQRSKPSKPMASQPTFRQAQKQATSRPRSSSSAQGRVRTQPR